MAVWSCKFLWTPVAAAVRQVPAIAKNNEKTTKNALESELDGFWNVA